MFVAVSGMQGLKQGKKSSGLHLWKSWWPKWTKGFEGSNRGAQRGRDLIGVIAEAGTGCRVGACGGLCSSSPVLAVRGAWEGAKLSTGVSEEAHVDSVRGVK